MRNRRGNEVQEKFPEKFLDRKYKETIRQGKGYEKVLRFLTTLKIPGKIFQ
jgi:hypothetical protein